MITISERIIKILEETPGLLSHQIAKRCGFPSSSGISSAVATLKARGKLIQKEGVYYVSDDNRCIILA